jgi:hypothetical protein
MFTSITAMALSSVEVVVHLRTTVAAAGNTDVEVPRGDGSISNDSSGCDIATFSFENN